MKWKDTALRILKSEFRHKIFSATDAFTVLNWKSGYSKGTVYRILHDLIEKGHLERLGRGIYRTRVHKTVEVVDRIALSDRVIVELLPGPVTKAGKLLEREGIEFMATGSSLFYRYIHHLPKRFIHLIYVVKGAGEPAVVSLREEGLRALLKPTRNEISLALENFSERDIFVVREFSELPGNVDGSVCLERALVDLYFETSRGKIPFSLEEVGRIFLKVFRNEPVSLSRLFKFGKRRGIRAEMIEIARFMESELKGEPKTESKHVRRFMKILEKVELR